MKSGEHREHLTPQQLAAVDMLASGKTLTSTAQALAVGRQAVSTWLHHNPQFAEAIHRRRNEIWLGQSKRLRGLLPKAVDVLEHLVTTQKDLSAAIHIIRAVGMYGPQAIPPLPFELEEIETEPDLMNG
jgi:hypothetical protein